MSISSKDKTNKTLNNNEIFSFEDVTDDFRYTEIDCGYPPQEIDKSYIKITSHCEIDASLFT